MTPERLDDQWQVGLAYEAFMGRWSRLLADRFIGWLDPDPGLSWLDVGCGTGALTSSILQLAEPGRVVACDPAKPFVEHVGRGFTDPRLSAVLAGVGDLPTNPGGFDRVVSGLVFNFLPDPQMAVEEMRARSRPGGVVAAYVWDYGGRMEFLRHFWDEVVSIDKGARALDEGVRFPMCQSDPLETQFRNGGLLKVESEGIEIPTRFESFSDYWTPFTGRTGPAPSYVASLSEVDRSVLRDRLEHRLAAEPNGAIELVARAWAVRGSVP